MTDYTKLVKALRCQFYGDQECADNCPYCGDGCMPATCAMDAADAIEALQATIELMKPYIPDFFPDANKVMLPKMEVQDGENES